MDTAIQNPDGDTDRKYVLYDLEEAGRYSMAVGLGAELARIGGCENCLDAPAGQTGFSPRVSFDITRNNLWGLAHSISLRTRVSTLDQRALLNYTWPRFRNQRQTDPVLHRRCTRIRRTCALFPITARGRLRRSLRSGSPRPLTLFYRYTYRRVGVDQATSKSRRS